LWTLAELPYKGVPESARPRYYFMSIARWLPIALALAFAASPAQAGPIGWGYTSKFTTSDGPFGITVLSGTANIGSEDAAMLLAKPAGSARGSGVVTVGEVAPGYTFSPDDHYLDHAPRSFAFRLDLQDEKSGQRGAVGFEGGVGETSRTINHRQVIDRKEFVYALDPIAPVPWLASATLRLGDNDYTVELRSRQGFPTSDGFTGSSECESAFIDADVRVSPAHATPEPATLLLGAIGLAGLGLRRLRRAFGEPRA